MKDPYKPLWNVLEEAHLQASLGKGQERHAADRDLWAQPMFVIPKLLQDRSGRGHLYQAMKKLQESLRLPHDRARAERLGAIVYIAASILLMDAFFAGQDGEHE